MIEDRGHVQLQDACLTISPNMTLEQYTQEMKRLIWMQRHVSFWIGDLVAAGERLFGEQVWELAPDDASLQMIERFHGVSVKVPRSIRNPKLSWTHHASVANLNSRENQIRFLQSAEKRGTSSRELIDKVTKYKKGMKVDF
jgi:hypothetical protein